MIDEGLNIGTYNEIIYLRNDNNVSEALGINIIVKGEKPDWVVDPADFEHSMAIFGKMRFNNIFSSDDEDMLAAFYEGKCIGVTSSTYIRDMDMWYALLTVYSNQNEAHEIEFRMWDASKGITYAADPGMTINFVNDAVIGTPNNLIIFDARDVVYQNIALVPGWNWISFNIETNALNDLNSALADMTWDATNYFKSEFESKSANYSVNEGKWIVEGTPFLLNNILMYKVSSSVNQLISLAGDVIQPSSIAIPVRGNLWSYISYIPNIRLTLTEALAGYDAKPEDVIKSQNGFAMYSESIGWLGSLRYLEPNKGYMLFRKDPTNISFYYPNNGGSMGPESLKLYAPEQEYVNNVFSGNMNMIAVSDIEPKIHDKILTYVGDELSSETTLKEVNGKKIYFITVSGEEVMPVSFELERNGEILGTSQIIPFSNNSVSGTIENPMVIHFKQLITDIKIYPNPTKKYLTISLKSESASKIDIRVVDVMGRELIYQKGSQLFNGISETELDCSHLRPGIYFVKIWVDGTQYVRKINKQQ